MSRSIHTTRRTLVLGRGKSELKATPANDPDFVDLAKKRRVKSSVRNSRDAKRIVATSTSRRK